MARKEIILSLLKQSFAFGATAFLFIVLAVFFIPHLPLANKRTFHTMLRAQIILDREQELAAKGNKKNHLLLLGSSVVERGINQGYMDSLLESSHVSMYATNAAAGGFFAKANLIMFRALLDQGLRPRFVTYGIFLQELNGRSAIHGNVNDEDTTAIKLKSKSLTNMIWYGRTALSPILDPSSFHIYLFALNHAFNDVHDPNFFQRLSFGENMFERDSSYVLNNDYLKDLKEIYFLCKERNIPFAFFNTPVRPKVESLADLPYLHRLEAYHAVEKFAVGENIPIWNLDKADLFTDDDFLDTYHLTSDGARKMTKLITEKIGKWQKGYIEQDITQPLSNSSSSEVKDSLIRTVFDF